MTLVNTIKDKICKNKVLSGVLIIMWTLYLYESDAYHSSYFLCSLVAFIGLINHSDISYSQKQKIFIYVCCMFFSGAVMLANWRIVLIDYYAPLIILIMFTGGSLVALNCVKTVFFILDGLVAHLENKTGSTEHIKVFWIAFGLIVLEDMLYLFWLSYPGNISGDSVGQIGQAIMGEYHNHHPFWHTMLYKLSYEIVKIFGGNAAVGLAVYCVFQSVFLAFVFALIVSTISKMGFSRTVVSVIIVWYILMPYNICFSITMWKDIPFAGATALMITSLVRILFDLGKKKWIDYFLLAIGSIGMGIFRTNGLIAIILSAIVLGIILYKKKKVAVYILIFSSLLSFYMTRPFLKQINVPQTDFIESLSIPAQQIAYVVHNDLALTEEQRQTISKVIDADILKEVYKPDISDPVKNAVRHKGDQSYLISHKTEYLKLWIELGMEYPSGYICAWADQTKGYWNAGYPYALFTYSVKDNDYGIERVTHNPEVQELLFRYFRLFENKEGNVKNSIFKPFISIGLHVWILGAFIVYSIIRRRRWYIAVPILAILATLLIATPVFCELRYLYSLFTSFPILLAGLIIKNK